MMNLRSRFRFKAACLLLGFGIILSGGNCNNYDILSKLERPEAGEKFADRFYMFVSSWQTMGDMSGQPYADCAAKAGVAKADCACTKAAADNGLRRYSGHEFRAYLGLTPSYHPPCRAVGYPTGCATNIAGPWYNTQDNPVMSVYTSSAFASAISSPIKFTEKRIDIASGSVWTGATTTGSYSNSCNSDWSVADSATVNVGDLTSTSTTWEFSGSTQACNTFARIYCFATSPP